MRRTLWFLAIATFLAAPGFAQKRIQFSWTPGSNAGWTLTGYTLYETTSGNPAVVATIPQADNSYSFPIPSAGYHTYELTQDATIGGRAVQSLKNPGAGIFCQKMLAWRKCVVKSVWQGG